jgi:hypothetical protein
MSYLKMGTIVAALVNVRLFGHLRRRLVTDAARTKVGLFCGGRLFGHPSFARLRRLWAIGLRRRERGIGMDSKENALPHPATVDLNNRGKHLLLTFAVEDGEVFPTPWSATMTYAVENVRAEKPHRCGAETRKSRLRTRPSSECSHGAPISWQVWVRIAPTRQTLATSGLGASVEHAGQRGRVARP